MPEMNYSREKAEMQLWRSAALHCPSSTAGPPSSAQLRSGVGHLHLLVLQCPRDMASNHLFCNRKACGLYTLMKHIFQYPRMNDDLRAARSSVFSLILRDMLMISLSGIWPCQMEVCDRALQPSVCDGAAAVTLLLVVQVSPDSVHTWLSFLCFR